MISRPRAWLTSAGVMPLGKSDLFAKNRMGVGLDLITEVVLDVAMCWVGGVSCV